MAFNLPPPWDPGFALPDNVRDEGLERRAFVTRQMPRGTYDQPDVGYGGYAVPQYIKDEGYGQGTFTTTWMPRGTAPNIPHNLNKRPQVNVMTRGKGGRNVAFSRVPGPTPMGGLSGGSLMDEPFPEPFDSYGHQASAIILSKLGGLVPGKRAAALKKILDAIDPSLYSRAMQITRRYVSRGLSKIDAIQAGIARAMSAGILAELHRTGQSGNYPQPKGQLGLGCYNTVGRVGLGAAPLQSQDMFRPGATAVASTGAAVLADGTATADGKLIWSGGQWRVASPADQIVKYLVDTPSSQIMTPTLLANHPIYVGPFAFDPIGTSSGNLQNGYTVGYSNPAAIPKNWAGWIAQQINSTWATLVSKGKATQPSAPSSPCPPGQTLAGVQALVADSQKGKYTLKSVGANQYDAITDIAVVPDANGYPIHQLHYNGDPNTYQYYDYCDWLQVFGLGGTNQYYGTAYPGTGFEENDLTVLLNAMQSGSDPKTILNVYAPFAKFNHPITGEQWGVFISLAPNDPGYTSWSGGSFPTQNLPGSWSVKLDTTVSITMQVGFVKLPTDPWFHDILEVIFWLPALIMDTAVLVVGTVLAGLGDLACAVLGSPNAVKGAQAAGGAAGGPVGAAAGAAGALLAQNACGTKAPVPTVRPFDWTPWIVGGAGLLAVVAIATRKKRTPPP